MLKKAGLGAVGCMERTSKFAARGRELAEPRGLGDGVPVESGVTQREYTRLS